ncbi:MAG: hypothetical protein WBB85_13730, partial [Albidovulum sp.]|uniref:hypothetical protein n=1 Tax=Albidovulum sp. TaxID=1872424 RepID=UPI003C902F07
PGALYRKEAAATLECFAKAQGGAAYWYDVLKAASRYRADITNGSRFIRPFLSDGVIAAASEPTPTGSASMPMRRPDLRCLIRAIAPLSVAERIGAPNDVWLPQRLMRQNAARIYTLFEDMRNLCPELDAAPLQGRLSLGDSSLNMAIFDAVSVCLFRRDHRHEF